MSDVQINTPSPNASAPIIVPVERRSSPGSGTIVAIILALILAVALVWYFVGYRPTNDVSTQPANPAATINVNVPPITVNTAAGSNAAPAAGASAAPAKPAAGGAP